MSHVHEGPLATYNSLTDEHLAGYFANSRMRRHLRKSGLVTKKGEIVTEATYRLNMSRKEHKKHVKDMLAQAIVHKTLDLERARQSEIKKKLEEIAKIQLVRRVRASTNRHGDEAILPLLSPRPSRPGSSPAHGRVRRNKHRPYSAPRARAESRLSQMSVEEEGDVLYLDDEGRPITPAHVEQSTGEQNQIDTRHLHSLDTAALRKYAMLMAKMEEGRGLTSPYMLPQVPLPPRTPHSDRTPRSARRVQSASPQRPVTTDARIARLHRPETAKSHSGDQQTMCRVMMKYHGWALHLARETFDPTQEIIIEQQHCGGNTLTVFKERLVPGSKFEFISYRHRGYPFSLTLYVDGQMDSRVSTCCEYRHSRGAKIGGKQGHFSLLRVDGAIPCYKCQVSKGILMRRGASPKKSKRPSERHNEEVIVVSTKKDHKDDEQTEQRIEKPRHTEDVSYDDDFEESHSSSSSSSSSESESETESSTRKDEDTPQETKSKEKFNLYEARGEDTEDASPTPRHVKTPSPRRQVETPSPRRQVETPSPRRQVETPSPRRKSPRAEVNGTGREIDDYSSDEDSENKREKVISMEGVEAEPKPVGRRRSGSSSSTSSASSTTADNTKSDIKSSSVRQPEGDNVVVSMDLLDKEEFDQERALQERRKRDEARRQEEEERLQQQREEYERKQEEKRQAEEARRQQYHYEQQKRQEEYRRKEEERRLEVERERQRRNEEDERRREEAAMANARSPDEDSQTREENRIKAQKLREAQILEEQIQREAKRKEEERAREEKFREEEATREQKRKDEEERKKWLEDSLSSSRTESSTARSTASGTTTGSSASEQSSAQSTPRNTAEPQHLQTDEKDDEKDQRSASPLPPPAIYEKRQRLEAPEPPPRPVSPFPDEPAVYIERPKRDRAEPIPPPAVYEPRPKTAVGFRLPSPNPDDQKQDTARSSHSETSQSYTQDSSASSDDDEDDEDEEEEEPRTREQSKRAIADSDDEMTKKREQRKRPAAADSDEEDKRHTRDQGSGTADSSSDSSSSGSDNTTDSAATPSVGASGESPQAVQDTETEHTSPGRATSESDGENMHGGADPDNVAQQDTMGDLHPLRTRQHPPAKTYDGKVAELLTSPESVELSNVLLNKTQVYEVASHLEKEDAVKMVSLCNTGLDDDDLQRLTEALSTSPSEPVMLNLSLNRLTEKSVKNVLHVLKAKPSVKILILQNNPVGNEGVRQLVEGLHDLHRQARQTRAALAAAANSDTASTDSNADLSKKYLLQELDLADTGISDEGASHAAQLLANNVYIEALNLSHNPQVTAGDGWNHIGSALAKNRCLKTLTLDGNKIGDSGMQHLARGLNNNRVLRALALEDAGIGAEGGKYILELLKRNTTILELTLSPGNTIPEELQDNILKYIALNRVPYNNFGL